MGEQENTRLRRPVTVEMSPEDRVRWLRRRSRTVGTLGLDIFMVVADEIEYWLASQDRDSVKLENLTEEYLWLKADNDVQSSTITTLRDKVKTLAEEKLSLSNELEVAEIMRAELEDERKKLADELERLLSMVEL